MVFLKNTGIRVGHSVVWNGRYSPRFAQIFQQVSFWLMKLVERAFFSKKFKYASVMYSHVVISGFERFIFLTIFVYDGLLVGLLYSFYRLIVVSKFFRKFSFLFRRRPLSFPLSDELRSISSTGDFSPFHSDTAVTSIEPAPNFRPYYSTYYSRFALTISHLLPRKHLLFGWRFFKRRFSYFRNLQIQASQYFIFKKKSFKGFNYLQRVRTFLRLFFRNFSFFRKFKIFSFYILKQSAEFRNTAIKFFFKKIFRNSSRYQFFKRSLFSSFLHEFFSKILFYIFKSSPTSQMSKSFNYTYFNIFFNTPTKKPTHSYRRYRKILFRWVKSRHRTSKFQGRVSFFPLLLFFQKYLRRLKRKYRYYMSNPAFFFNYSRVYFRYRFSYISRRRRRRLQFRLRKPFGFYLRRPGFRFGLRFTRRLLKRRDRILDFARQRVLATGSKKHSSPSRSTFKSVISKSSQTSPKPRDFKSLFTNVNLLKSANVKPSRHFSSFNANRSKPNVDSTKPYKASSTSSASFFGTNFPSSIGSKKTELPPSNFFLSESLSPKSGLYSDRERIRSIRKIRRQRLWQLATRGPLEIRKPIFKILQRRKRRLFAIFRWRQRARNKLLRKRSFKRNRNRRRIIRFNSFNFNNLLVGGLYKKILFLIFKRNLLGRMKFYNLFKAWITLAFGRLFSFFFISINFVLIFPMNLRSNILAKYITRKLEFHYSLNELVYPMLKTLRPFFKGFYLLASGRFSRAQRASVRKFSFGKISFSSLGNSLSYIFRWTRLKYGVCSIKLWLLPKLNKFFRKTFYQRQADKNYRLVLFDSFFNQFVQQFFQRMLKKLQFFQHTLKKLLKCYMLGKLTNLCLEPIKFKFYWFKTKIGQLTQHINTKGMCTIFTVYSISFIGSHLQSFFFFDVLGTRIMKKYFHSSRNYCWFFSLLVRSRRKRKLMWAIPISLLSRKFLRSRRTSSVNFIPLRYGSH